VPRLQQFLIDESVLAKRIYRDYPHETTGVGLIVEAQVRAELERFLRQFTKFVGTELSLFMRLDVFASRDALTIIEVNVELQDGWGVALNLLRASGHAFDQVARLPAEIIVYNDDYLPEFELAQREALLFGHQLDLVSWRDRPGIPAKSVYDDKAFLSRFSRFWRGETVRVPAMYSVDDTPWESLPQDVVFKFREKYGNEARKARYSVIHRGDMGKGKFMRLCYNEGTAVAQDYVEPMRWADGSAAQGIIMCSGCVPATGYTQVAPAHTFVINDKSARKGPLVFA